MILAGLCAVGAMVLFGIAAVLQALATSRATDVGVLDPRLLLRPSPLEDDTGPTSFLPGLAAMTITSDATS